MASVENLLTTTQIFLSPEFVQKVSVALGQPADKMTDVLKSIIPTFLQGLVNKASSISGAESLINLAQKDGVDDIEPENLEDPVYLSKGSDALNGIFGSRLNSITTSLGTSTGVNPNGISKLMGMMAPMVMGVIGRKVKNEGLTPNRLMGFLDRQKPILKGFEIRPVTSYATTDGINPHYAQGRIWGILAVAVLALLAYLWWWTGKTAQIGITPKGSISMVDTVERSISPMTVVPAAHLDELTYFLSSGDEALLPKRFSFENLNFATGETELLAGEKELDQIAEALKTSPFALVRIEAFTDNVGDSASNLELSENRAIIVKEELVARGIEAARIEAVGRGQEAPLASNETEEGRLKNRRVELIVTGIK